MVLKVIPYRYKLNPKRLDVFRSLQFYFLKSVMSRSVMSSTLLPCCSTSVFHVSSVVLGSFDRHARHFTVSDQHMTHFLVLYSFTPFFTTSSHVCYYDADSPQTQIWSVLVCSEVGLKYKNQTGQYINRPEDIVKYYLFKCILLFMLCVC